MAPSEGLRLIAARGHVLAGRGAVLLGALSARAGASTAIAVWPSAAEPMVAFAPCDAHVARWVGETFPGLARAQQFVGPATWQALRARALLRDCAQPVSILAAERALGRALDDPRMALISPSRSVGKVTCFVFERRSAQPAVVVKAMARGSEGSWLAHETSLIAALRERLGTDPLARALPLAPLHAGSLHGDWLLVEPLDPLAAKTAHPPGDAALAWLGAFQQRTTLERSPWDAQDEQRALASVADAWGQLCPWARDATLATARAALVDVRGTEVPRCVSHGDYWRGNLACDGEDMRVFDWEWGQLRGDPFVDRWCLELGELRGLTLDDADMLGRLQAACERVRDGLARSGMDPGFALATLAPSLATFAHRHRFTTGTATGWATAAVPLMHATERLLGSLSPLDTFN